MLLPLSYFLIPKVVGVVRVMLVARVLDPSAYAHVSAVLIMLAMVECLTQPGLAAALVQSRDGHKESEDRSADAWAVMFYRGFLLGLGIYCGAPYVEMLFEVDNLAEYVRWSALIPIITGVRGLGRSLAYRHLDWRGLARFQLWTGAGEVIVLQLALMASPDAFGVVLAMIVIEVLRSIGTHAFFPYPIRWWPRWQSLAPIVKFGRWVWLGNVVTMVLSNVDKVLSARWYGQELLAGYHMTSRVAQMVVSEAAWMSGGYLFPKFSSLYRDDVTAAVHWFLQSCRLIGWTAVAGAILCLVFADWVVLIMLGPQWLEYTPLLRILAVAWAFGALMAPLTTHVKAVGKPQWVVVATVVQLLFLVPGLYFGSQLYGPYGLAGAWGAALGVAVLTMIVGNLLQLPRDGSRTRFAIVLGRIVTVLILCAIGMVVLPEAVLTSWWIRVPVAVTAGWLFLDAGLKVIQRKIKE